MIPVHTQKSLDQLTWNEIQKLHSSLGLKATAATRTRRDYQRRIVAAQPQPVAEPEAVATALTCDACPLARHIDGVRYCCGLTNNVTRGHWEAQTDCYDAVAAQAKTEIEVTEPAIGVEAPIVTQESATEVDSQFTSGEAPESLLSHTKIRFQGNVYALIVDPVSHIERSTLIILAGSVTGVVVSVGKAYFPLYSSAKNWDIVYEDLVSRISTCKNLSELLEKGCQFYRLDQFQGMPAYYGSQALPELFALPITQPKETPVVTIATTTDDAPPNRGDNSRNRVISSLSKPTVTIASIPHATKPKADDNFMTAFMKESEGDRKFNDLAYLSQLEMEAQLAIERTVIGSEDEAIAYRHLRSIEKDIKYYGQPRPEPQPSLAVQQLEIQMKELKTDVLSLFKITAFDPSILPLDAPDVVNEGDQNAAKTEPEGTIHWHSPLAGTIVGSKGALRNFYLRKRNVIVDIDMSNPASYEIMVVISANFTASESRNLNVRHGQIRAAINAGRAFDPKVFKNSPQFLINTKDYRDIGRIMQGVDGRWWAWATNNPTGHPFFDRATACKYLEKVANRCLPKESLLAREIKSKNNLLA